MSYISIVSSSSKLPANQVSGVNTKYSRDWLNRRDGRPPPGLILAPVLSIKPKRTETTSPGLGSCDEVVIGVISPVVRQHGIVRRVHSAQLVRLIQLERFGAVCWSKRVDFGGCRDEGTLGNYALGALGLRKMQGLRLPPLCLVDGP